MNSLFDATSTTYRQIVLTVSTTFAFLFLLGAVGTCIFKRFPHFKLPIGKLIFKLVAE